MNMIERTVFWKLEKIFKIVDQIWTLLTNDLEVACICLLCSWMSNMVAFLAQSFWNIPCKLYLKRIKLEQNGFLRGGYGNWYTSGTPDAV